MEPRQLKVISDQLYGYSHKEYVEFVSMCTPYTPIPYTLSHVRTLYARHPGDLFAQKVSAAPRHGTLSKTVVLLITPAQADAMVNQELLF